MSVFDFTLRAEFVNRLEELEAMAEWWEDGTRDALCMYGRRRVGKSWLFQRFADGKDAFVLFANERAPAPQFKNFADQIEKDLGVRPAIDDPADLIRVLYRLGKNQKVLAVIDEFPLLLPKDKIEMLSAIASVMEEERDHSKTKLILCGSIVAQMESLMAVGSPLHGRLVPQVVQPMRFGQAQPFLEATDSSEEKVVRYSVTGGMARYLDRIGSGGDVKTLVCERVLDHRSRLFNDPRDVLERELREPAVYFSLLEELARGEAGIDHLAETLAVSSSSLTPYLKRLREMRLVTPHLPLGAPTTSRKRKYRLDDGFVRFWFRFVFPYQEDLASGLKPTALWNSIIKDGLSEHTAQTFEDLCRDYARSVYGEEAQRFGGWWGEALPKYHPDRTQEEIDVAGLKHKRVALVGECKWTKGQMPLSVLTDLDTYKIPAMLKSKDLKGATKGGPRILLFARSGFTSGLETAAAEDPRVTLVSTEELAAGLTS